MAADAAGQLEEVEQPAQGVNVHLVHAQHHRGSAAVLVGGQGALERHLPDEAQGLARQIVQVVPVVVAVGNLNVTAGVVHVDHRLKQVALPVLDILAQGVEVGGELGGSGENTLAVLALGLAEELLQPLAHEGIGGLVGAEQLNLFALAVQQVPGGHILPHGVGHVPLVKGVHGVPCAGHEGFDVGSGHGDGQQAHGGQHGEPAAHVVGHHKGLPAVGVGQGLEGPPGLVGGGVDALIGLLAVLLHQQVPEHPERHGGLGGAAGLGDHVDGPAAVVQLADQSVQLIGAEGAAHKADLGAVGGEHLQGRPGPQVGPADADDHQHLGILADLGRSLLDAGELLLVVVLGQAHPAHKVGAGSGGVVQLGVGGLHLGGHGVDLILRDHAFQVGQVKLEHVESLLIDFLL